MKKIIYKIHNIILNNKNEKYLIEQYDIKNNSFSLLLFFAAIGILFFHSYPLFYGPSSIHVDFITKFFNGYSLGAIIVAIFFSASGFFMAQSIINTKKDRDFVIKRFIRIFPSLLFLLIFISLFVAPSLLKINYVEYISTPSYYARFILDNLFLIKSGVGTIGTLFSNNPYPSAIIGSLWTLKHTVFTYIIIYICNKLGFLKTKNIIVLFYFLLFFFTLSYDWNVTRSLVSKIENTYWFIGILLEFHNFIELLTYFFGGVLLYLFRNKIRYSPSLFFAAILTIIISRYLFLTKPICMLLIPYCTVCIGSIKLETRFSYLGNLSYPIFLYGFPVQQTIIYLFPNISIYGYIYYSVLGTILFAIIINTLIDEPIKKIYKEYKNKKR